MTIEGYVIKSSTDIYELEKKVQLGIDDGWQPYGDLKITDVDICKMFIQVMIKGENYE